LPFVVRSWILYCCQRNRTACCFKPNHKINAGKKIWFRDDPLSFSTPFLWEWGRGDRSFAKLWFQVF